MKDSPTPWPRLSLAGLMMAYLGLFGSYAHRRYLAFETGAFDLGVYAQPLWNFINGRNFAVSLMESDGPLRWANHVEPILFLIAPIYALWPDPRTLLWLQVTALTLAAIPLYALASRRLANEWAALTVVLAYFLMPATESVTLFDFHAVSLAPLFLLTAIYFLDRTLAARGVSLWLWPLRQAQEARHSPSSTSSEDKTTAERSENQATADNLNAPGHPLPSSLFPLLAALFILLALSCKEDISLHVFMIGLYLLILRRQWLTGGLLAAVGLIWFYVVFQMVIPAYRTAGQPSIFVGWFETLGDTPLEIALSPITAPAEVLALIFRPGSLPALAMITLPLAGLPIIGWPFLLMAAPSIAFVLLSNNPTQRQLETWHYAAPMLPFLMLATIDGLARLNQAGQWLQQRLTVKSTIIIKLLKHGPLLLLLGVSLIYHHWRGYSPLSLLYEPLEVTAHHQLGRELAAAIPPEASVLAQAQLVPQIAHRSRLAIWDGPLFTDYDYIWLDVSHPKMPNRFNAHGELLTGLAIETEFGFVATVDGYLLMKKGADRIPTSEAFFSFTEYDQLPPAAQPFAVLFGESLKLVAVETDSRRLATSETEPQLVLYFEVMQTPATDYHLFVYRLDRAGQIRGATDYPQPALFWWPTSHWQAGDLRQVRVNTLPWWTGDQAVFGYAIGLSQTTDPWQVAARLPVTWSASGNPAGSQPLDEGTLLPVAAFRRWAGLPYPEPLTGLQ